MKKKIKVALLFDKDNSWIFNFIDKGQLFNHKKRYRFKTFFDHKKISSYDIVFILGYMKLLKKNFLKKNKHALVIHESNLPKGRGFAPMQWQILEGKNKIISCLIKIDEKADTGKIIIKRKILLKGDELNDEIRKKQAFISLRLMNDFLKKFPKISFKTQKGKSSFFRKRKSEDSMIDLNKNLKSQFNLLRICDNEKYPAFFNYKNKKYILKIFKENSK